VSVPRQTPRRINFHQDVRYARIVKNAATQHLFRLRFMPELQHDEKRWLTPLAIFLCVMGLLLIVATTVEALAPFIYSIW